MRRDRIHKTIGINLPVTHQHITGRPQLIYIRIMPALITTRSHRLHTNHTLSLRGKRMQQRATDQRLSNPGISACYEVAHLSSIVRIFFARAETIQRMADQGAVAALTFTM
jgi:ABC-type enterochelin transport system permease subunit